jgi:hypothetical protein
MGGLAWITRSVFYSALTRTAAVAADKIEATIDGEQAAGLQEAGR